MSIVKKRFQNSSNAIAFLEMLSLSNNQTFIFRGHADVNYRLENTWQRHRKVPHESWMSDIDEAMEMFKVGLEKLGKLSHNNQNRFEALEFGRHHGVPTPCLDFSYSPYVALFFAFDGVKYKYGQSKNSYSVIYALNIDQLACEWARKKCSKNKLKNDFNEIHDIFLRPSEDQFRTGYPGNFLQFIPFPGKSNLRMQRQLGALLFDTIDYRAIGKKDFEEFVENISEAGVSEPGSEKQGDPILYKIFLNQKMIGDIFQRLELMNITGGFLYDNADGVARDIKNAYYYNPKFF